MHTTDAGVSHNYTSLGIYVPKMILEDAKGCKVPVEGKDTIRIYGVSPLLATIAPALRLWSGELYRLFRFKRSCYRLSMVLGDGTVSTTKTLPIAIRQPVFIRLN